MIRIQMDPVSERGVKVRMNQYRKLLGKTKKEITIELGKACSKEIAMRIQPYGLSAKVGEKFEGSIAKQVNRATRNAELAPAAGTAKQAHKSRRNQKGQVPKSLPIRGRKRRSPFFPEGVTEIILEKKENAGMAKGAWIAAAETLGGKISGIPKWIRRHASANGSSKISASASTSTVAITNELNYAEHSINDQRLRAALKTAYKKQWKRMTIAIKKIKGDL
jgi:hypothetical protein